MLRHGAKGIGASAQLSPNMSATINMKYNRAHLRMDVRFGMALQLKSSYRIHVLGFSTSSRVRSLQDESEKVRKDEAARPV